MADSGYCRNPRGCGRRKNAYSGGHEKDMAAKKEETREDAWIFEAITLYIGSIAPGTPSQEGAFEAYPVMPRKFRLSRPDFARLKKHAGRRVHADTISLLIIPLANTDGPKFACVIAKKTIPKASARNAVERRVKEVARALLSALPDRVAIIVYPKREAQGVEFSVLERDMKTLFSRI